MQISHSPFPVTIALQDELFYEDKNVTIQDAAMMLLQLFWLVIWTSHGVTSSSENDSPKLTKRNQNLISSGEYKPLMTQDSNHDDRTGRDLVYEAMKVKTVVGYISLKLA